MSFFYISVPHLSKCKNLTRNQISEAVLKDKIADGKEINVERSKFKMCNLDTLIAINDKLLRVELGIEGFLRKVDRQYLELVEKPHNEWFIRLADLEYTVPKYLYNFIWNESKFPRTYPLSKIAEVIETKLNTFESEFRNILCSFSETKTQIHQNAPKEELFDNLGVPILRETEQIFEFNQSSTFPILSSPSLYQLESELFQFQLKKNFQKIMYLEQIMSFQIQQLNLIFLRKIIWRFGTYHIKNRTINIFNERIEERNALTELTNQNIVNRNIDDMSKRTEKKKFQTTVEEFIEKIKEQYKITVREFKFEAGRCGQNEKKKIELEDKLQAQTKSVSDICLAFFAEGYELYLHQKILRLIIESSMRYGNDPSISYLIEVIPGKEKTILDCLIKIFGDELNDEYYGSKEETDEPEDFYPFVYLPALKF